MKARTSIRRLWTGIVLLSVVTIGVSIARWWSDARPPVEILNVKAREKTVMRGGILVLEYETRTHRACEGISQRVIVDSQEFLQLIEPTTVHISEQDVSPKRNRATVIIPVPYGAAVGPARYQAVLSFQCNPLQRVLGRSIEVRTPTVRFEILPSDRPSMHRLPFADPPPEQQGDVRRISFLPGASFRSIFRLPSPPPKPAAGAEARCEGMVFVRAHYRRVGSTLQYVRAHCRRARNMPL